MSFNRINESWHIKITGMVIDSFQLNLEVGELPKVNFGIHIRSLAEKLSKDKLKRLIECCEERLKCLT